MNVIGIVCEYNPFHSGHLYMINESRRRLGEDSVTVCVMSGDFVQRGEAALYSKFARAEAACRCGADLVLELPLPWSVSSAEGFAEGAVSVLAAAGCTHLSFGSECGELEPLAALAREILNPATAGKIKDCLSADASLSYAMARQRVLSEALGETGELLSGPNNILAVEYLKAIYKHAYPIIPMTVKRIGSGHDKAGESGPKSASEIRALIECGGDVSGYIPSEALEVYRRESEAGRVRRPELLETALLSRLRMFERPHYEALPDASDGAGIRLYNAVREGGSLEAITAAARSKRYPLARMRRMLYCAALGISAECTKGLPPYARVLAADKKACALLRKLEGETAIPVLTRASSVRKFGERAERVFAAGASAHDLYTLQFVTNDDKKPGNDWRKGPSIV